MSLEDLREDETKIKGGVMEYCVECKDAHGFSKEIQDGEEVETCDECGAVDSKRTVDEDAYKD